MGFRFTTVLIPSAVLVLSLPLGAAGGARPAKPAPKTVAHAINLNTATATELVQLPHIGPKTAERIILFRKEHGPFRRPEELMNVKGIGEKAFATLRPFLVTPSAK